MTKLHFNYKDIFRALRLGFSAKKVWMMSVGLLVGFLGYALLTYLAYLVAGSEFLTVWESFRLLPFPEPSLYAFPWYSWLLFGAGVGFFLCSTLLAGCAVSKVTYEQLRGDEFYEARDAFRFAFKYLPSTFASPLLLVGFAAVVVGIGLLLSLLAAIPYFGEIVIGVFALPAFAASLFIVYLLVVFFLSLLIGPSIVGATKNDTFDTIFEVFSCVNEQPARLVWYLAIVGLLSELGSFLLGLASSAAGRIGTLVLQAFAGEKMADILANASFYFKVNLPAWWPGFLHQLFDTVCGTIYGLPQLYSPTDYVPLGWGIDVAAVLVGVAFHVVAIVVVAFGCSIWYSGNTMVYAVLAKKKDDKNILEIPNDEAELIEPVEPLPDETAATGQPVPPAAAGAPGAGEAE